MISVAKVFRRADLRVALLLVLVNAIIMMLCTEEIFFGALIALACVWRCLCGTLGKGLKLAMGYVLLSGLSYLTLGVRGMETIWMFSNLMRHMLIPIAYTFGLSDAPTGTLLTVFHRLRLPKSFGISTVVLLRIFPTIGYETQAIRASLKFRGVGMGFWSTVAHLPSNFERTLVPLLIRTTKISDELAAAAMVRGVRLNNEITSFDEVRFRVSDAVISVGFSALAVAVYLAEVTL
jgi:energy-coupling factor transport system permease protein